MILGLTIISFVVVLPYLVFRVCVKQCVRDSIVSTWLTLALFVFGVTELLSHFDWFKPAPIVSVWGMLLAGLTTFLLWRCREVCSLVADDYRWLCSNVRYAYANYRFAFVALTIILLLTLVHVLLAPSAEPDSLSYHLPRATHWLANGNVGFYETAIARQNFQAPLYSYFLAHVIALTRSDIFFNLIQWFAWCVNAVVVSLIAKECGVSKKHQLVAALLAVSLPQAVSQVIVTVNDLFAATAVMAFILYLIRILNSRKIEWKTVFLCAAALGIGLTAKYTSLVHAAGLAIPLSVWGLFKILKKELYKDVLRVGMVLLLVAAGGFSMLLPQVTRNLKAYNDPFSGEPKNMLTNVNLTPKKYFVNLVKNVSMHTATPLYSVNRYLESAVRSFAGERIEDPDISYKNRWYFTDYRIFTPLGKSHLTASNPLHFMFFCFMLIALVLRRFKNCGVILYSCVVPVLVGSALYALVFKWQPACARLQIPYFMLIAVGLAQWLEMVERKPLLEKGVPVLISGYAVVHVILWQTWFTPAFLYGSLPKSVFKGEYASLQSKIRILNQNHWDKEIIESMRSIVPTELTHGYSIFFTDRERQYFGNAYHDDQRDDIYRDVKAAVDYVEAVVAQGEYASNIALLTSSDHGNTPCDANNVTVHTFAREFILWRMIANIDGRRALKFRHLGVGDPVASANLCFGEKPGLVLSDRTRESVLSILKSDYNFKLMYTNKVFSVFKSEKRF